tara:strand:- start:65 stop:412 length:348 start_codon:yes stop_codon:yes gene_type:complete
MALFRAYLLAITLGLVTYTMLVGMEHGWNLLPIFFGNIVEMSWQGQFNLDFMSFLSLSAIWVAWRHQFSGSGIVLGILAFFGGMLFLAVYLLWASGQASGNTKVLLLGRERAKSA